MDDLLQASTSDPGNGQFRPGETIGVVTIRCPTTGEEISTGLMTDAEVFEIINFHGHRFRCDACSEVHTWEKKDAMFQRAAAGL